jgi:hypothetical protein
MTVAASQQPLPLPSSLLSEWRKDAHWFVPGSQNEYKLNVEQKAQLNSNLLVYSPGHHRIGIKRPVRKHWSKLSGRLGLKPVKIITHISFLNNNDNITSLLMLRSF